MKLKMPSKLSNKESRISDDFVELNKQKIKNKLNSSTYIILPIVIVLGILIYLVSPISKINQIKISGNGYVPVNEIKNDLNINSGDSIFKVFGHKKKINENVAKKDHRIKSIDFHFSGFNNLTIKVTPYREIGYETKGKNQYLILENGNVTNIAVKDPKDDKMPYIVKFNDRAKLRKMIQKYLKLPKDIRDNVRVISFSPTKVYADELHVYMRDGNRIIILMSDFNKKMGFYRSIATQLKTKSIINLEVGAYSYPISDQKNETKKSTTKTTLKVNKETKKSNTKRNQ
ncbi:MAG: FtsQ-type POTRA domain-containing protein [Apilactobacillus sp.]|uniref:cell division protein FtsQ/DivIB n=1 Tax=Apilactobacillus sp. TaxID=2767901 RepID=UPI0025FF309F|nr:FtsQ-type POTRA domain-containing protein [Apilactobacillus sp.]MCT6823231.1 FtsQ-type POTRA domain-containing protein [Apilactobacillus sp.]